MEWNTDLENTPNHKKRLLETFKRPTKQENENVNRKINLGAWNVTNLTVKEQELITGF